MGTWEMVERGVFETVEARKAENCLLLSHKHKKITSLKPSLLSNPVLDDRLELIALHSFCSRGLRCCRVRVFPGNYPTPNRDPVDNPTPKKIPPFYTKNPYFRSIISKQLVVGIIYLSKVAIRSSKNLII
jgi:hypothetical protein